MPRRKMKEIEAGVQPAERRSIRAIARPAVEASSQVFAAIKTIRTQHALLAAPCQFYRFWPSAHL